MNRKRLGIPVALCALGLLIWLTPNTSTLESTATASHTPGPPPTENWRSLIGGGEQKRNRKAWFEQMHRVAPGQDWREMERENGRTQLEKRNALAGMGFDHSGPHWVERGSDNQAGRMHVVAHSPDGQTLVAGSARGGVWLREFGTETWRNIGDNLYGGAHWLAVVSGVSESDPDILLAGTDWGQLSRTTDNGASWFTPGGLPTGAHIIRRLVVSSDEDETIFLITGTSAQMGLYRSIDAGVSFERVFDFGAYKGDLWMPRDGGSEVYLTADDALWFSPDQGENWTTLGQLGGRGNRSELVGSEAGAPTLYAVTKKSGDFTLRRSDDGGATWEAVHEVSDYWSSLAASISDPDLVAWGGVELHVSRNGGETFALQNRWFDYYNDIDAYLHADIPGLEVLPDPEGDGEIWYISTDGGLFHSTDALSTVHNLALTGLRVSQYYTTHTSSADPNHVAAGAQDQGYQRTETELSEDGLFPFVQHISGDYARHSSTDGSHNILFSLYPGITVVQVGEDDPQLVWADFPVGEVTAWLPPLVADPIDPERAYFGGQRLYRYERNGAALEWNAFPVSDTLISHDDEYISAIAFSPVDPALGYLITNYGSLFKTENNTETWIQLNPPTLAGQYFYGQALLPSRTERDTLTLGGSGYSGPSVYRTVDGGQSFVDWSSGLPPTLVYGLAESRDGTGTVFAGTQTAAYLRAPDDPNWTDITQNQAPVITYWSVEALHDENTMRFGTYGRGIWDYHLEGEGLCSEDEDGDGFACDVDCNDTDATVFPGATEVCDGIDQNCDPDDLDEADNDGDGFAACEECDDSNRFVHPNAVDNCELGLDRNCNDQLDCEQPGGCACAVNGGPVRWWWLLPLVWVGLGRKRRPHRG